jgi:hypothetical protein
MLGPELGRLADAITAKIFAPKDNVDSLGS